MAGPQGTFLPQQKVEKLYELNAFTEALQPFRSVSGLSQIYGYLTYDAAQVGLKSFRMQFFLSIALTSLIPGADVLYNVPTRFAIQGVRDTVTFSFPIRTAGTTVRFTRNTPVDPIPVPFRFVAYGLPLIGSRATL